MGTILARNREVLIERALQDRVIPRPNALKHVRQLPGMKEISPVWLSRGEGQIREILERYDIQAASDRDPLYPPSEWLITLLYEDRIIALDHTSSTFPTVIQVVQTLCTRMLLFEECGGADCRTDEDVPSFVCEIQRQDLQALLGTAYHDFLLAFHNEYQPSCNTSPVR